MTSIDVDLSTHDAAVRLRLVLARLTRALRQQGSTGLTLGQVSALATVEQWGPMRMSSLAHHESVGASVATRMVASLEELHLVQRAEDPDDRRASLVELSPAGRDLLDGLRFERTIGLSARLERLSAKERGRIEAVLPILEKLARDN
jgi:DNA-binding MarR family transcriptional regulator